MPRFCAISIMARSLTSGLTVSRTPELLAADVELRHMVEVAGAASVVDHQQRRAPTVDPPGAAGRWAGCCKNVNDRSQIFSRSPSCSSLRPCNRLAVDERAVAAVQVFDKELAVLRDDLRVLAADAGTFQHDVAIGMAPHYVTITRQFQLLAAAGGIHNLQNGHSQANSSRTLPSGRRRKEPGTFAGGSPPAAASCGCHVGFTHNSANWNPKLRGPSRAATPLAKSLLTPSARA